jgi:hypothetical protein
VSGFILSKCFDAKANPCAPSDLRRAAVLLLSPPVAMVAVWVVLIVVVSVPMGAVMLPVTVSTECVVIVPVSALVSLIAIAIFIVVAFMVAT